MPKKKTFEEVRELFTARNYTLLSTEYKNARSPLLYICDQNHNATISLDGLHQGNGCSSCAGLKKKTIEEVRQLFESRNFQLISDVYKNSYSPLKYRCSNGHQNKIRFDHLRSGRGCSSCADYGFNPSKPAILYYLRFQFEGNFYYKIGITNRDISKRFQLEKIPYTIVKETPYQLGKEAHTQEQAILKEFSASRYKGKPFLTDGNTELFSRDVLQLDYETIQNFAA